MNPARSLAPNIVSGERVFKIIDTKSYIRKEGQIAASNIQGNIDYRTSDSYLCDLARLADIK